MHRQRLFGVISATVTLLGVLLPWASGVPIVSRVTGTAYLEGWLVLLLIGLSIAVNFAGDDKSPPKAMAMYASILSGLVAVIIALVMIFSFKSRISEMDQLYSQCTGWTKDIHYGFGLYLVIIGGISQVLTAFLLRSKELPETKAS